MNVLIFAKQSHIGGLTHHCGLLAQGLTEHKHAKVVLGMTAGEGTSELAKRFDVETFVMGGKNPMTWIKAYNRLKEVVSLHKIEVIHTQNRIPALLASIYCHFHKNVKYIWSNHLVPIPNNPIFRMLTHYGYCAVAEGVAGRDMLMSNLRIPKEKVKVVNLGIDLSRFKRSPNNSQTILKKEWKIEPNKKVILLYGRLSENKGHLFLLDALKGIDRRDFYLVFPGKDPEFKAVVDAKAREMGLEGNLVYPGFINGPEWLSISDLMVLPSRNEGFPQACIEAYAMGVPVIRTKSGGYEDTKDMCFGVDFGDIKCFNQLLADFFDNPSIYAERALKAQKLVNRYSIEQMADDYYAIYEEAMKS